MTLLSVNTLHVAFGKGAQASEVLHGVSFDLAAGETLAIVGESGSGKSVAALSINRLVDFGGGRITEGSMLFERRDGTSLDLATADEAVMQTIRGGEIGMIFQEPMTSLNPVLSIGRQVEEALRLHRGLSGVAATDAARAALERVRIADAARQLRATPNQLSGGMLQRVMIAMALASNPRLLICDEPTTALDVTVQAQIMALLAELKQATGMALIFISHDIGLVSDIADKVLVMQEGRAVEYGPADRVLSQPQHDYTRYLLRSAPHFSGGKAAHGSAGKADPVLSIEGLRVRFPIRSGLLRRPVGSIHAVEDIDIELEAGRTLALVGESGSGKSTTARAVVGLQKAKTGSGIAAADQMKPQMVFQNPYASLNPRLTVETILAEPLIAVGQPVDAPARARMQALVDRVGLPADSLKRYPHQFSGGQRQRLCIARVLMLNPAVLVLDEPVSALDVSVQGKVLDLLVDLQNEHRMAYLFISHDMAVVERIAHRVAVMYGGRIVEIGDAQSVLANPQHPYTRALIAAVPSMDGERRSFALDQTPVPTLVRPLGYVPPAVRWTQCSDDHKVLVEGP